MTDRKQIELLRKDREWTGATDKSGYGRLHVKKYCEKKTGRNFFAHRISYMIHRGYITPDEFILHQCHNRLCCNPKHHKLGDHYDNMDDLARSGRVHGEKNHRATLSEDEVWEILCLYYFGDTESKGAPYTVSHLCRAYDVPTGTMKDIVGGRTWKHIYEEFWEDED